MSRKLITNVIGSDMYRLLATSRIINVERTQPCWILCCRAYGINHKKTVTKQHELFQRILQQKKSRLKERRQIILQDIRATKSMMREKRERIRESGQIIMQDIKETRDKVKERMEEVIEKENVFTIPNLLCVSRIIASPVLGYLIIHSNFNLALGIFAFAGFSDLIDGWIARTFKSQASKIGSFLDPMADKILIASLFLSLTYMDFIPVVLTGGIILRDVLLVAAAFYVRYKSLPPPRTLSRYFDVTHATAQLSPTAVSKWNTGMQLVLVASTLAAPVFNYVDHPVLHAMWYVTAGTTLASAASYLIAKNTYKFLKPKKKL